MKITEENLLKQKAPEKRAGVVDKTVKLRRSCQTKPRSSDTKADKDVSKSNVAKRRRHKTDAGAEEDNLSVEKLAKIQIPSTLKKQLVDDWEFINELNKLVNSVRAKCGCYLDKVFQAQNKEGWHFYRIVDSVGEILSGIWCYFDKALPVMLLYKKECQQYNETIEDEVSPSTVYGAEHLLRLFARIPELLSYVNTEEETLTGLQQKLLDFHKFLQKNQSSFFISDYDKSKVSEGTGKEKAK